MKNKADNDRCEGGDDKHHRRFVRANFPCKITIYTPDEHTLCTHTENIGAGGIKVIIEEHLETSSLVGLELMLKTTPIVCKGRVVWVTKKESIARRGFFLFDTGIEFYEIKDKDQKKIKSFVEKIAADLP